jgi:hypothetical protein
MVIVSAMSKKKISSLLCQRFFAPHSLGSSRRALANTARTIAWPSRHSTTSRQPNHFSSFGLPGPYSSKPLQTLSNIHGVNIPSLEWYISLRRINCVRTLVSSAGPKDAEADEHVQSTRRKSVGEHRIAQWEERFSELMQFKNEHGHTFVPCSVATTSKGHLGQWVNTQRSQYLILQKQQSGDEKYLSMQCNMFHERIHRLNEIDFVWDAYEAKWQESFQRFLDFVCDHNGETMVPRNYAADPALSRWVVSQRQKYMKGTLADDKIQLLEKHGFVWMYMMSCGGGNTRNFVATGRYTVIQMYDTSLGAQNTRP